MELLIHNGEIFKRELSWYIRFSIIFAIVVLLSIVYDNSIGAIVIFFLLGGYFYYSTLSTKKIKISINENGITIDKKELSRLNISGYLLEIDTKNGEIKNIVFITNKSHQIYTIADNIENLKKFIENLDKFIPMLSSYQQTSWEKLFRKLKL
ncbi:hypothetical protein K9M48_01695 [Candidatus Gracilibacteria bacterium]|nr:hypothetical protein [Candidatus Gracilibacteria bacterium]